MQLLPAITHLSPVQWPHSDRRKMSAINRTANRERERVQRGRKASPADTLRRRPRICQTAYFYGLIKLAKVIFFVAVHFGRDFYWKCDTEFPLILNLTPGHPPAIGFCGKQTFFCQRKWAGRGCLIGFMMSYANSRRVGELIYCLLSFDENWWSRWGGKLEDNWFQLDARGQFKTRPSLLRGHHAFARFLRTLSNL